jgi:hypothetical protein
LIIPDELTQAKIVYMIIDKKTEDALKKLSEFYHIESPKVVVGTIKGKRKTVFAVYIHKERKIYTVNSDIFYNPFIILHEFYHHIRSRAEKHRGSEKHANRYAQEFINSYMKVVRIQKNDLMII